MWLKVSTLCLCCCQVLQHKATNIAELVTLLLNVVGYFYLGLTILGTLVT